MMNDIINPRSALLVIKLYSALKLMKYSLPPSGKTSFQNFFGKDKLYDPIDRSLCNTFCNAWKLYCKE